GGAGEGGGGAHHRRHRTAGRPGRPGGAVGGGARGGGVGGRDAGRGGGKRVRAVSGRPAADARLWLGGFAGGAARLPGGAVQGVRRLARGGGAAGTCRPRPDPRQREPLLADGHRRVVVVDLLRGCGGPADRPGGGADGRLPRRPG